MLPIACQDYSASFCFSISGYDALFFIWLFYLFLESVTVWGMASGCFLVFRVGKNVFFPLFSSDLGPGLLGIFLLGFMVARSASLGGSPPFCEARTGWSSPILRAGFTVTETVDYARVGFGCVLTLLIRLSSLLNSLCF